MRIAISLNIALQRGPEEHMIHRLARAGFDGLDFNFCDLLDRVDWTQEKAVERLLAPWQEAAREHHLPWVQGHGPMMQMFSPAAADVKARALSIPAILAAGKLGVKWMVFHPDVFPGAFDTAHRQALIEANAEFFRTLLPACEKTGVGIAIENIVDAHVRHGARHCPRAFGGVPEDLCQLVDYLHHPLVGVCWDTGHAQLNAHQQAQAITALGPRLQALHIQENDGQSDDHMLPFATARGVDWAAVAAGLRAVQYPGAFTFEVRNGLDGVPDALLDDYLALAVKAARHILAL